MDSHLVYSSDLSVALTLSDQWTAAWCTHHDLSVAGHRTVFAYRFEESGPDGLQWGGARAAEGHGTPQWLYCRCSCPLPRLLHPRHCAEGCRPCGSSCRSVALFASFTLVDGLVHMLMGHLQLMGEQHCTGH